MRPSITVLAPAKLNLALSIGPVQQLPDHTAFHPICSWMMTVSLFDELMLTRLEDDRLSRYAILWHADAKRRSDINWSITKDLAVQAHLALEERTGRRLPVQMKLEKRIPVGGGLGGGSSDAAAMLRAVNALFDLNLSLEELFEIGAELGSDVPFLVRGGSAVVEGFGDRLTLHEPSRPQLHAVVAFPDAACPTGRVYGLFDEISVQRNGASLRTDAIMRLTQADSPGLRKGEGLFNDLAPAAIRVAPQLEEHLSALAALAERPAHITGSGSSVFVLCDDDMHAMALADAVERKLNLPAVAVQSCTIPHHAAVA